MRKRVLAAIMSLMMAFSIVAALGVTQSTTVLAEDSSSGAQQLDPSNTFYGSLMIYYVNGSTGDNYYHSHTNGVFRVALDATVTSSRQTIMDAASNEISSDCPNITTGTVYYALTATDEPLTSDQDGCLTDEDPISSFSPVYVYVVPSGFSFEPIYIGTQDSPAGYMIVPDSKTGAERINYIMYNANYFFDSLSFNIDSVTMLGSMGDGYLIKISAKTDCESEPTEPTEPTESAAPNAEAQKAMAAAVRTSSYASPTGESMTRIAANEGGAAIDATTGIVPAGAKFTSSQLSSGATYDNAANIVAARIGANTHFAVFEMDLTDNNNMAIHQLDGMINVTLPIPEGMTPSDGNILAVYRIEDDGTMTRCDTATANGFLTFATNHFSTYVMVEEPASGASAGTKATSPKTAESAANMILVMIAAMSLAGAAVVSKKRYNG